MHQVSQYSSLRVIVSGLIAQYPLGGLTWHYLQYVLGLKNLGHDVYYLEDSGQWPYSPVEDGGVTDPSYNVKYLADVMARFGLDDRWVYHFPGGALPDGTILEERSFGLSSGRRNTILSSADLLINVSAGLARFDRYPALRRLIYVDTDPVFTQIRIAAGESRFEQLVNAHDVRFTFGEGMGKSKQLNIPAWRPTRQPIVLSEWSASPPAGNAFTTVMNWVSFEPIKHKGQTYGHKDIEFKKFLQLPKRVDTIPLELAVSIGKAKTFNGRLFIEQGWRLVEAEKVSASIDSYKTYIESSLGEWSVAKNGYVVSESGWFSERSACYLAAGRPVILQDTGYSRFMPTGEGLLRFATMEEAADSILEVAANPFRHSQAARAIAEEYFDSDKVLTRLLHDADV